MDEYIKREAVLDLARKGRLVSNGSFKSVCDSINSIPAADVRPVVRCKDCRHRDPEDHKCDSGETERQGCPFKVADDYFCAYGE